jgi:peptidyl-prolyl cis-trans isomerase C
MQQVGVSSGRKLRTLASALAALALGLLLGACACERKSVLDEPVEGAPSAPSGPMGLDPEAAARVLARVGDRVITLGDYAEALEGMDPFERMRYQTEDRRKQLLDEMIDLELLAQEAERRGLHETPAAKQLVRQILRGALLEELRAGQPALEEFPMSAVRAYYEAHRDEFREPERRRIAAIVVKGAPRAAAILKEALAGDAAAFGGLVEAHSLEKRPSADGPAPPTELAGDLGFVSAPTEGAPADHRVPQAVREAAFEIAKQGDVLERVVTAGDRHYIIRLVSVSPPRDRTVPEAERSIRVALLRQSLRRAEAEYEARLRKAYPVTINDAALAEVRPPPGGDEP